MVHLQDNVPVTYTLNSTSDCAYFAFKLDYSLNPKGTIMIVFEATKAVMLIVSDETRKPTRATTGRTILYSSDRYHPPRQKEAKVIKDHDNGDFDQPF